MKLYVIRHGESENNSKKIYTGWMQVDLTEKGKRDAEGAGKLLRDVPFDKIYSSDLIRAMHTADIALPDRTYETTPLLREYNVGTLEGQSGIGAAVKNRDFTPYGGENKDMIRARVQEFMHLTEALDLPNVAAFSHAGWLRMMLSVVLNVDIPHNAIACGNCTVGIFEYKDGNWSLHSWINQ